MNTLRLENINLHAPYRVMQDPERHNNFYFVSDSGARFDIDFAENDSIIPSGAYEFGITNRRHERSPLDQKLRLTIFAIVEEFFEVNGNEAMLYLADTGDRKQAFRNRLFVRWFNLYEHRDKFIIETAEGKMDGLTTRFWPLASLCRIHPTPSQQLQEDLAKIFGNHPNPP